MNIPTVRDFTCTFVPEDDLDGFHAWMNFGNLTVEAAYQKFCESPEIYQEDFMFMGDAAFLFYFPVIEEYVKQKEPEYEMDGEQFPFDGETHILAHCIRFHVSEDQPSIRVLYERIAALCHFVLRGLETVSNDPRRAWSPEAIQTAWADLLQAVQPGDASKDPS